MERDKWTCSKCGSSDAELNVHHLQYERGLKPWEYPDEYLTTLCADCHKSKHMEDAVENYEHDKERTARIITPWQVIKNVRILKSDIQQLLHYSNIKDEDFSIYKNVLVHWDEDHDDRVLQWLNELPEQVIEKLVYVRECEGCVNFIWSDLLPEPPYQDGFEIEGDFWTVNNAIVLPSFPQNYPSNCVPLDIIPEPYVSERGDQ
jgi:hypothetical protein